MRRFNLTFFFITTCLIKLSFNTSNVTKNANKYCSKDSLDEVNYSEVDLENLREDRGNRFTEEYFEIINFLRDTDDYHGDLWDANKILAIIVMVTLLILFVSFLAYIGLYCGCFKFANTRIAKC